MAKTVYKRILLKLSGEYLMGDTNFGIDPQVLDKMAKEIAKIIDLGVEVGLVIGGGNLFRGTALSKAGLGRVTGDHMGMLATVMNGLAFRDAFDRIDLPARILSAIPMTGMVDPYDRRKALTHLRQKRVVIFTAGTGNPLFTTDTGACLRAIEIEADVVLKATLVDGVYSADPKKDPKATHYPQITYDQILHKDLKVMDSAAICMVRDHNMPLQVFNIKTPNVLRDIVTGKHLGTLVTTGSVSNDGLD